MQAVKLHMHTFSLKLSEIIQGQKILRTEGILEETYPHPERMNPNSEDLGI